jgi:hypothetical protein
MAQRLDTDDDKIVLSRQSLHVRSITGEGDPKRRAALVRY